MNRGRRTARAHLLCGAAISAVISMSGVARAQDVEAISIPSQSLATALNSFGVQTGRAVMFKPELAAGKQSRAVDAATDPELALNELLSGSGLSWRRQGDLFLIERADADPQSGSAAGDGADGTVDTLVVTAQKREEDIQDVPIAISAFTQEDLTRSQVAGGPDLMTQVPNFTFTKTNFSSYSIQIRGIGTQAISATVDPAVAVAFNNTPFVRNRFFEQEFYDLQRVEVLRGPQGTLYGRNATAGVVNIISAKPSFRHEAKLSGDVSNYNSTRLEGMVNIPLVEDIAALRIAGAWTKREGYTTNEITGNPIDGRDLWSTRVSLRVEPTDSIRANLIWEHFEEDDDRLRSGKQLCKRDANRVINGFEVPYAPEEGGSGAAGFVSATYTQGCLPASMYSPDAFEVPNGYGLPYYGPLGQIAVSVYMDLDPYASQTQSRDLRVIESTRDPEYRAETNTTELQLEFDVTPALALASETAYATDELFSTQDFNRFNTKPGAFIPGIFAEDGVFCDPQLGCSDRLVLADLSTAKSSHFSQELRLSSDYDGRFNFSIGANFLRYDTEDKYYVFINTLTLLAAQYGGSRQVRPDPAPYVAGVTDNLNCLVSRRHGNPLAPQFFGGCIPIDPNPIGSLNDQGHNYFLSKNPYRLISYAAFGEAYYNITEDLKVTAGLRWTTDKKRAPRIPSWLIAAQTIGYPVMEVVEQEWREPTGRLTVDWKPDLDLTDETLIYGSYAHGYKAGGMNPPPAVLALLDDYPGLHEYITQPKTFEAEFIDAFEVGAKNTLFDGRMTFNANAFYYDYEGYQLSQIINRSAVTQNFDAEVWGLEIEADWRPLENLRIGFKGGYQNTRVGDGMQAIDIMDRTAGNPDWTVIKPFPTIPSNCIIPTWFATFTGDVWHPHSTHGVPGVCVHAYIMGLDPGTLQPYVPNPTSFSGESGTGELLLSLGYPGFDPASAPNNGEGIFKDLSGNELPNAPNYTATLTADYTAPLPNEWLATLHTDLYYQSEAWTRIFNMEGYDKLKAYTNVNLAAIFTNEEAGWNVMAYVKNVFDRDSITGAFLNSDDTGLTTNVFLTEPRLYGIRVTKAWTGEPIFGGLIDASSKGPFPFTVEIGGQVQRHEAPNEMFRPDFVDQFTEFEFPLSAQEEDLDWGDGREVKLTWRPQGSRWSTSLGARFGRTNGSTAVQEVVYGERGCPGPLHYCEAGLVFWMEHPGNYDSTEVTDREDHTVIDFTAGRDVGFGGLLSSVSLGLRYARLNSKTEAELWGMPDVDFSGHNLFFRTIEWSKHRADISAEREFEGAGPIFAWDASRPLLVDDDMGALTVEWNLTGGVLFGKQSADVEYDGESRYWESKYWLADWPLATRVPIEGDRHGSKSATVPLLGVSFGLSYEIQRLKLGAGYRWERFFDVVDGGVDEEAEVDRTIDGPYFKLAVGFGG